MTNIGNRASLLLVGLFALSCGADKGSGSGSGENPFGGDDDDDLTADDYFGDKKPASGGSGSGGGDLGEGICDIIKFNLSNEPPEVLLVLDRSGSMQRNSSGNKGAPSKWSETTSALKDVLSTTEKDVGWGLQMYPTCSATGDGLACAPTPCTVSGLDMAPDFGQASTINGIIDQNAPVLDTGATPTAEAIKAAVQTLSGRTSPHPKYILLATDGLPNCRDFNGGMTGGGESDPNGAVRAVEDAAGAGFPVFVVGIATNGTDAHETLNRMATAGARARDGATRYYPVSNKTELETTLRSIAKQVQDCTFQLPSEPPEPETVAVDIAGQRLGRKDWDFGPGNRSVVVKGDWCEKIKNGALNKEDARISFTCAGNIIP